MEVLGLPRSAIGELLGRRREGGGERERERREKKKKERDGKKTRSTTMDELVMMNERGEGGEGGRDGGEEKEGERKEDVGPLPSRRLVKMMRRRMMSLDGSRIIGEIDEEEGGGIRWKEYGNGKSIDYRSSPRSELPLFLFFL